jgi:hypothetical protein
MTTTWGDIINLVPPKALKAYGLEFVATMSHNPLSFYNLLDMTSRIVPHQS